MYLIIFHDRLYILRFGIERNIRVVRVGINGWCCMESLGKMNVVSRLGMCVMVCIISMCGLLEVV